MTPDISGRPKDLAPHNAKAEVWEGTFDRLGSLGIRGALHPKIQHH